MPAICHPLEKEPPQPMTIHLANLAGCTVAGLLLTLVAAGAAAADRNVERGKHLALIHCARCHSIDKVTASPFPLAPPFRTLGSRYPVDDLEEPLAEGLVTGHPIMPEFRFEPDEIGDFIAFLKSLQ